MLLTFLEEFYAYRDTLASKKPRTDYESHVITSLNLLLGCLESDYKNTIATIRRLKLHGETTFDLLYSILIPRIQVTAQCAITGLPRLFKLNSAWRTTCDNVSCYQLNCESVDLIDRPVTQTVTVGKVSTVIYIGMFKGTVRIDSLDAYPVQYHPNESQLRQMLVERGNKWKGLIGIHHMQFNGIAALRSGERLLRHNVRLLCLLCLIPLITIQSGQREDHGGQRCALFCRNIFVIKLLQSRSSDLTPTTSFLHP